MDTINSPTPPVVILGAGPTGLSAAYHLGEQALLIERNDTVGGLCRSMSVGGFTFDCAGHVMLSSDPYVHHMYRILLGDNIHWQDREAWIYSHGVYTRHPFEQSLYGLPPKVITDCLMGAIESTTALGLRSLGGLREEPANFEELIYQTWGTGIARYFAIPYNRKLWAVDLRQVETSWLGDHLPMPDLRQMIEGAVGPSPRPTGPGARFGYPLRGGFQALMNGFLPHLRGPLRLGCPVVGVSPSAHTVALADGRVARYERLISSIPLPLLVQMMGDEAPSDIHHAAESLRFVSLRCVHLGVGRERLSDKHWIYYPEDPVFHRIFLQGNASPHCNPPGGFGLTCEISYSPYRPLPVEGDALVQRCIDDCRRVGLLAQDDPIWAAAQVDLPFAHVVYDHDRAAGVASIRKWLLWRDIFLAGRYGEWEDYRSDHAFLAGKKAAEACEPEYAATSA